MCVGVCCVCEKEIERERRERKRKRANEETRLNVSERVSIHLLSASHIYVCVYHTPRRNTPPMSLLMRTTGSRLVSPVRDMT